VEKTARGLILNNAGGYYFGKNNFPRARNLFVSAYEISPQPLYFENALGAWSQLKEHKEALAFVEKELAAYPKSSRLRAYQAMLQAEAGDGEAAVQSFAKLLAEGEKQPQWLDQYLNLLVSLHRYDEALAAVREQPGGSDSVRLRLLQAHIYREQKKYAEA